MSTRSFRLTTVACAASWLLVGMHFPIVHEITGHGRTPSAGVMVAVAVVVLAAIGTLWALLRAIPGTGGPTAG